MRNLLILLLLLAAAIGAAPASAAPDSTVQTRHMRVALVAENLTWHAGQTNWIGVELTPEHGWHSYWRNPGEAGLATQLTWTLPAQASAGPIAWPAPRRLETTGLVDYGYDTPQLLLVPLHLPPSLSGPTTVKAHVSWLVCKDICIPGDADLAFTRVTTAGPAAPDPATAQLFATARARLPQAPPADWNIRYAVDEGAVSLGIAGHDLPAGTVQFYPTRAQLIDYSASQRSARDAAGLRLTTSIARHFEAPGGTVSGVLEFTTRGAAPRAYAIEAHPGAVQSVPQQPKTRRATPFNALHLSIALLFALLGGLILNLMPCVFPVLSIKAVGIMQAGATDRRGQRLQALAYTAGVILSCVAAAGLLLTLRRSGEALGWGFQLQSPTFVAVLACLIFVLGLSLSGVVTFGTRWMGVGQTLTQHGGLRGAFFTGVLAVVVASPCTAPFMGSAMGYALAQPAATTLIVFAALGLGLASPFLAIGFFPRLAGHLPKPGPWMESFKQLMAFPLYLTVVWLVWVVARQAGPDAAALLLIALVLLAWALWAQARWPRPRLSGAVLGLGVLAAGALCVQLGQLAPATGSLPSSISAAMSPIEAWSPQRVASLQAAGRTVFIDFTADWCLTCKVNERAVLDSDRVRNAFAAGDIAYLKADWTRRDPAITQALAGYGRAGVPLYVVVKPGKEPQILPQLLTSTTVIAAIGG